MDDSYTSTSRFNNSGSSEYYYYSITNSISSSSILSKKSKKETLSSSEYEKKCNININIVLIFFLFLFTQLLFVFVNIFLVIFFSSSKVLGGKFFYYRIVYHDFVKNESIKGQIVETKKIKGFSFFDESGYGNIYPLSFNDYGKNNEFEVVGSCKCCIECLSNKDCEKNMFCDRYFCVECKDEIDCKKGTICKNGQCSIDECNYSEDCKFDEVCFGGVCSKGCKSDKDCKGREICDWKGNCIIGCRFDGECNQHEICVKGTCSNSGCRDNFDCDSYEFGCINNMCISTNEKKTCLSDGECSSVEYCNYEYMICLENPKKETSVVNSRVLSLPFCTLYNGLISLFIMANSYFIATNIAQDDLYEKCYEKCSDLYGATFIRTYPKEGIVIKVEEVKKKSEEERLNIPYGSECEGRCKMNAQLKNSEIVNYAKSFCPTKSLKSIITIKDKIQYLGIYGDIHTRKIFLPQFSVYCKSFRYRYQYKCIKRGRKEGVVYNMVQEVERSPCSCDLTTVRCVEIIPNE